jgi:hypothetical protein
MGTAQNLTIMSMEPSLHYRNIKLVEGTRYAGLTGTEAFFNGVHVWGIGRQEDELAAYITVIVSNIFERKELVEHTMNFFNHEPKGPSLLEGAVVQYEHTAWLWPWVHVGQLRKMLA